MAAARRVIITCAVTGSVHTPTMSPFLPITPEQIGDHAIAAAAAGAAILHLHARDPRDGRPTPDPNVFMQFLPRIHAETTAVINISTGGGIGMSLDERLAAAERAQPEMASLNMGSMNFGLFPMAERPRAWQYDWEPRYLESTRDAIFKNTFADIEAILGRLGAGGTRFEFECYDVGHLYTLAHFLERGLVKSPLFVQTVFGILGGIGADPENLVHMRAIADKLFGRENYQWSILAAGRRQMNLITAGATMGSNVRVGLEDSLYAAPGKLAQTNAEQVALIRRVLESLSFEIATPADARSLLGLKGADRVAL